VKIPSSEDESASSKDESTSSEGGSTSSEDGSTSSKDESLLSAEVQAVQSKPFGPQATDTLTQSFDSGQVSFLLFFFFKFLKHLMWICVDDISFV
jgi:hypothetical protein